MAFPFRPIPGFTNQSTVPLYVVDNTVADRFNDSNAAVDITDQFPLNTLGRAAMTANGNRFFVETSDQVLPIVDHNSAQDIYLLTRGSTSVVMVSFVDATLKDQDGLEIGADDYMTKPFHPRELLARIRAVLRRGGGASVIDATRSAAVLQFDGWQLHPHVRQLLDPQGARVAVTGAEFDLLLVFCERPRRVLSRDQLIDLTQGRGAAPFERSIDVLVSRLRQKMERDPRAPALIKTIRSGGYLFTAPVERL